ncbi:MAG: hypothetical protein LBD37_03630 [Treponema sp.]|nr:hypothetical protein [Treponema sp.]
MFLKKTALLLGGFSLLAGAAGILAAWSLVSQETGRGYGVLMVDAACQDREIGRLLAEGGLAAYSSESTQWVFLDDFGGLRRVPLDGYAGAVEPFDPRNDGYADALRRFFVRDGKRRFYIPLAASPAPFQEGPGLLAQELEKRLARMPLPPYSLASLLPPCPFPRLFILFALAAAAALLLSGAPLPAAALLPSTASFAFAGPSGLALGGVLFALFEPLRECFASRFREGCPGWKDASLWLGAWSGLLIFLGIAFCGAVPPMVSLLGLFSFLCVLCASLLARPRADKALGWIVLPPGGSRLPRAVPFFVSPGSLPFALAALAALAAPCLFPGGTGPSGSLAAEAALGAISLPSAADYQRHVAFQSSFSQRPLWAVQDPLPEFRDTPYSLEGYYHYYLGADGLIAGVEPPGPHGAGTAADLAFPLGELADGLQNAGTSAAVSPGDGISVFFILVPAVLSLIGLRKNRERRGLLRLPSGAGPVSEERGLGNTGQRYGFPFTIKEAYLKYNGKQVAP